MTENQLLEALILKYLLEPRITLISRMSANKVWQLESGLQCSTCLSWKTIQT